MSKISFEGNHILMKKHVCCVINAKAKCVTIIYFRS